MRFENYNQETKDRIAEENKQRWISKVTDGLLSDGISLQNKKSCLNEINRWVGSVMATKIYLDFIYKG